MDSAGTSAVALYAPSSRFFEDDTALARIFDEAPYLARCSDNKTAARIRPREYALRYPYMQINRFGMVSWLIFDLDHANSRIWDDVGLPAPNLAVRNRTNGHSHLYYAITNVCTTENARAKPIQYMKAVYSAMAAVLQADPAYSGPVAKTPGHPWWETTEIHNHVYELGDLADYVELEVMPWRGGPKVEDVSHSRHCILFEEMRFYAYSIVNQMRDTGSFSGFMRLLEAFAHNHNSFHKHGFSVNLPLSSLRSTVRSIARWTWDKYQGNSKCHRGVMQLPKDMPLTERQSLAARRTHDVRHKATESKIRAACAVLRAQGKKLGQAAIALIAKVTRQTVATYSHVLKEQPGGPIRNVKHGVHQIPAPAGVKENNHQPLDGECAMPQEFRAVKVHKAVAMATPRDLYFNVKGVTAYSCLIPQSDDYAHEVHFVSGADGKEYGQFHCKKKAIAVAVTVVDRSESEPKNDKTLPKQGLVGLGDACNILNPRPRRFWFAAGIARPW